MQKKWSKPLQAVASALLVAGLFVPSAMAHGVAKHSSAPKGTIIFSDNQFPDTLNPWQTDAAVDTEVEAFVAPGGTFLDYNPRGALIPEMLVKVPTVKNGGISKNGKTITLTLHKGLRWSNGDPITAQDFKFWWQVGMDSTTGPFCAGTCDHIKSITLPNKYTAVLHMRDVYAPAVPLAIPGLLDHNWKTLGGSVASAAKVLMNTAFNYEGPSYVGAGPYKVTQFVNNVRIELAPNKYYKSPAPGGAPKVAKYIFLFYSDVDTEIAGAAKHETDITTDYTLAQLPELLANKSKFTTKFVTTLSPEHMELNMLDKTVNGAPNPLVNRNVRLAINLAIDRFGIQKSVFGISNHKQAANLFTYDAPLIETPSIKQPFADPKITGAWDPLRKKYVPYGPQSVADAKKLLKGTPCAHGCDLQITSTTLPQRAAEAAVVTSNLAKIGIKCSFQAIPSSTYFATFPKGGTLQTGHFEAGIFAYVGVIPDPDQWKTSVMSTFINRLDPNHSPVDKNDSGLRDGIVDNAFKKAAASFNPAVRRHWYYVAQEEISKQAIWIDLSIRPGFCTWDSKVSGVATNGYQNSFCTWNGYALRYR